MSYRSRGYKKKENPVSRRARIYGPAVGQLAKDVAYLGSLVNSEPHYHLVQISNNFSYLGSVIQLSTVPVGDLSINRTGTRILPRFLNLKGYVSTTSLTTRTDPINVRVIIFRWYGESTGSGSVAIPSASSVLATTGTQFAPLSPLNDDVTGPRGDRIRRIEVHKSMDILIDNIGGTPAVPFDCNITVNNPGSRNKEHMQFLSSVTESPVSGGFYALFISDDSVGTQVHYKLYSKLVFYDN